MNASVRELNQAQELNCKAIGLAWIHIFPKLYDSGVGKWKKLCHVPSLRNMGVFCLIVTLLKTS